MKFTVDSKNFKESITNLVELFKDSKILLDSGLPISLEVIKNSVILLSDFQGVFVKYSITCTDFTEGSIITDYADLLNLHLSAKETKFVLDGSGKHLNISSGRAKFKIPLTQSKHNITPRKDSCDSLNSFPLQDIKAGIKYLGFKPIHKDCLDLSIKIKKNWLTMTTNDSYIGVIYKSKFKGGDKTNCGEITIPLPLVKRISSIASVESDIKLGLPKNSSLTIKTSKLTAIPASKQMIVKDVKKTIESLKEKPNSGVVEFNVAEIKDLILSAASLVPLKEAQELGTKIVISLNNKEACIDLQTSKGEIKGKVNLKSSTVKKTTVVQTDILVFRNVIDLLPDGEVMMTVWDNAIIIEYQKDKDKKITYVLPQVA